MPAVSVFYPGPEKEGRANLAVVLLERLAREAGVTAVETVYWQRGRLLGQGRHRRAASRRVWLLTAAYEQQWPVLPAALRAAGIAPLAARRGEADPLVVAGGVSLALNPGPLSAFADVLVGGDAEPVLGSILGEVEASGHGSRAALLERLAGLDGVRTSASPAEVSPLFHTGDCPAAQTDAAAGSHLGGMVLVETGRGCPVRCRFCAVGHLRPRPLFFPPAEIIAAARRAWRPGLRVGLVGAGLSWHPQLDEIIAGLEEFSADLSPASLDARLLAAGRGRRLLRHLAASRQRTVTLAPESGSERLRRHLNKHISDEVLEGAVRRLVEAGVLHLKLYLMYGLPGENDGDLQDAVRLARRVRAWMDDVQRPRGRAGRLQVSANPFVPKPATPWGDQPMPALVELRRRFRFLRDRLAGLGGVDVSGLSPRLAVLQCLLDRAGPELAPLLGACRGKWPPPAGLLDQLAPGWQRLVHQRRPAAARRT